MTAWRAFLYGLCGSAFLAVAGLLTVDLQRRWAGRRAANHDDRLWILVALGGFALALLVRIALVPQLSNWQAQVLPVTGGVAWERYGPGTFVFQWALRTVMPWTDTTLFVANALLGAAVILPYTGFLREVRLSVTEAAAAVLFLALSPTHARTSASASEHVLSSTLTVLALWAWLRGCSRHDRVLQLLALACVPAVALVRVDAWPQLSLIALWPVLALSPAGRPAPDRIVGWTGVFGLVWLVMAVVLLPMVANHPTPDLWNFAGQILALVPQFFVAAFWPPFWMPPLALLLACVGAVVLYRSNRRLLACVVLSLFLVFVPIGRGAVYNLLESRYALVSFCLVGVLCAAGFAEVRLLVTKRFGARWSTAPALLALFGVLTAAGAVPAMRAQFTFEDEYAFLRRWLRALPDGCVVFSIPARDNRIERDVDAGLDLPSSPLVIAYPRLRFRELTDGVADMKDVRSGQCVAYYESALCSIEETAAVRRRFPEAVRVIRGRCTEVRAAGTLDVVAEARVSPRSVNDLFGKQAPTVRLSRWRSSGS